MEVLFLNLTANNQHSQNYRHKMDIMKPPDYSAAHLNAIVHTVGENLHMPIKICMALRREYTDNNKRIDSRLKHVYPIWNMKTGKLRAKPQKRHKKSRLTHISDMDNYFHIFIRVSCRYIVILQV